LTPEGFDGANMILTAPTDGNGVALSVIGDLPVQVGDNGFVSYWRPNRFEIDAIMRGAPVRLYVLSNEHPPVAIEVGNP
jgi:hypothetical protein